MEKGKKTDYCLQLKIASFDLYLKVNYNLNVSGYSGDAGEALFFANGAPFSTVDKDNDSYSGNCAEIFLGAWW